MKSSGAVITPTASPDAEESGSDGEPAADRAIASALRSRAAELDRAWFERVGRWEKFDELRAGAGSEERFIAEHLATYTTYLALWFETGDSAFRDLYVTQKRRHLYEYPAWSREQLHAHAVAACDAHVLDMLTLLERDMAPPQAQRLRSALESIHRAVHASARKRVRVLFVGDCLFLDLVSFLEPSRSQDGIDLDATYVTTKNPAEIIAQIRGHASKTFDLVAYSPFTYEQSLAFRPVLSPRSLAMTRRRVEGLAAEAMEPVAKTIQTIAETFECPILVHNTAAVRRRGKGTLELARAVATRRLRRLGRDAVNPRIARAIDDANAATFPHVHLLDEAGLLRSVGDLELGRSYTHSAFQHAAVLGRALAPLYQDVFAVVGTLWSKKVIVCDLDNTLWEGVIGEGAVRHHMERQRALEELRRRGIVLAVNSKNDPANVRWEGAALGPDSFVSTQITWDPKVSNMRRIQDELNLKLKDFVFIDDRPDEREMMSSAFPEIEVLDALSPRTWRRIELWGRLAVEEPEMDRTKMYRDRAERQRFIDERVKETVDEGALFQQLGIRLHVRRAEAKDLKRVAELINRTNQFNLNGSRTSLAEVKAWHESASHCILVADAADKFGDNGTVCVAVVEVTPQARTIIAMVLSCRVFGYGIEHSVLHHVARRIGEPSLPIAARFSVTPHNQPCHRFLPEHGFVPRQGVHVLETPLVGEDPSWLTVEHD